VITFCVYTVLLITCRHSALGLRLKAGDANEVMQFVLGKEYERIFK
jgi:hypothetical protein